MKLKTILVTILFIPLLTVAQNKTSRADNLFYGYQYAKAIDEYKKEMLKDSLSNSQKLNLADAYLKTGNFDDAAAIYLEVNKNDTIMSVHRFNKMLQSLSKNSEKDRVKTFLRSKASKVSSELIENAEFNYLLLDSSTSEGELSVIDNLVKNSPQGDFSPAFYKDGLLFSSSRPKATKGVYAPSGESYIDIYYGKLDAVGNMISVENFSEIPDFEYHQATPFYSERWKTFYYILSNMEGGKMAFDENGKNALAIGSKKPNSPFYYVLKNLSTSFYYPFLDEKTERLFFAANFEDEGYGGSDLYYVSIANGQVMSAPVNLGPRVNSPGNEISPFVFNGSLYFSSDVFYGMGGMDVYKSNILDDNSFTIPVNIGEGINSTDDDFGFIIKGDDEGHYNGYFSSNRKGGKGGDDLYKFTMENLPGLKTFSLKGTIMNSKKRFGLANSQITVLNKKGEVINVSTTNEVGDFRVEIPWQEEVTVQVRKVGFSRFDITYSEAEMEEVQTSPFILPLYRLDDLVTVTEDKTVIRLNKFYFGRGKSAINDQVRIELDKVVDVLNKFPELKFKIESHTDSRGSGYRNKKLSENRAEAIKDYLVANGVNANSILEVVGYGEEQITNKCTNGAYCLDFLHKQNERTLFVVEQ